MLSTYCHNIQEAEEKGLAWIQSHPEMQSDPPAQEWRKDHSITNDT